MGDQVEQDGNKIWLAAATMASVRLDGFLRQCLPHLSRQEIHHAIADGCFRLNGRRARKGDQVHAGDRVTFVGDLDRLAEIPPPAPQLKIPILYEDEAILAVNKPAGVATHGFSARDGATVANFLAAQRPATMMIGRSRWEPGLVHRLDIETSGVLVIAKTQAAFESLLLQFRRREVKKTYLALVWGEPLDHGTIDFALAHDRRDKRRMVVVRQPDRSSGRRIWRAVTHYRLIGSSRGTSLLEIEMATGVTHQIRVHLSSNGYPIVGDALYGADYAERFGLARHFLHARSLTLRHPTAAEPMIFEAELALELRQVLQRIGMTAAV
jgi:23S rRNA pseudouridine1911/1915/1917 synthase